MGVMYGKVRDRTFWIMDAAALPVQGTETRVNAGNEVRLDGLCRCGRRMLTLLAGYGVHGSVPDGQREGWKDGVHAWLVPFVRRWAVARDERVTLTQRQSPRLRVLAVRH